MKKIYGLIGHPVKHSLSASMHNAAFIALGMDAEYQLFDKTEQELEKFIAQIKKPRSVISGLNVTIPYKVTVHDLLKGSLSENAAKIGAVNTIIIEEEGKERKLIGENTDGPGFLQALDKDLRFDPKEKIVFVLGAGGAARAIIMALGSSPEKIYFTDIDEEKALRLEADYKKYFGDNRIYRVGEKDKSDCIKIADLLVNATGAGMKDTDELPIEADALHKNMYIFDCIYNPKETKLLKLAKEKKLEYANGLGMLLYQGIRSFELWTGVTPPEEAMRNALNEALG
ncbi:MAG: shikimate dehydrogenase [Candidatus Omnitrophica bacterium]|nr:shikimate dehydrogenase [Candidatus Omnitrophota bacterium]MDD5236740.1 shikimate dehydrogenase [Candidatus Omnitrophota bacterium]MDD5610301.1 shikimate dehydrogenase [Candidatus Omnitrophota bacterium]